MKLRSELLLAYPHGRGLASNRKIKNRDKEIFKG